MQVNAGFSAGTAVNQNYIYRLNTTGTAITAWTSTGIVGSSDGSASTNPATDLELFPDGRVLVAYRDSTIQIYSADLASRTYGAQPVAMSTVNSLVVVNDSTFYVGGLVTAANAALIPAVSGLDDVFAGTSEGIIIRYTLAGATPVADWATYIGGAAAENFTAIALTPNGSKLVFAVHSVEAGTTLATDGYSALVNAVDATPDAVAGRTEILTGVINVQAAKPAAFDVFSLLGGSGTEGTSATSSASVLIVASNTGYWVAGNTASTDLPGTAGGVNDSFLSFIPINGSAGPGFQSSYNGGAGNEITGGIGYDAFRDRVFVFGTTTGSFPTTDTAPTSIYFDNTFGGGTYDIFIATFTGNVAIRDYATYIGGAGNDYLGNTGVLLGTGHVTYSAATDQVYLATTVHSSLPANVIGAGIPGYDLIKSNAGNDVHVIFAFNINVFDHGDAPVTYEGTIPDPAAEAISQFLRLGATVDAEYTSASGAAATGDDLANNGSANDEDGVTAALPVLISTDASYSVSVSVLNNTGVAQILQGWIDLDGDGVLGANERATFLVPASALQQTVSLVWSTLPGITSGQRYLRLRLTDTIPADNGGTTIDERSIGTDLTGHGEVEDYALTIFPPASNLSGAVYRDLNNDGIIAGAGETGISGVTVTLTGMNDLGAAVNLTSTTDASGNYSFLGIRPSDATGYTLTEMQPGGFLDGKNTAGTSGGTTVNNPLSDVISGIVLRGDTTASGYDFGELPPSSFAGTVYRDLNNDGGQLGAGETGVNAVTVTLTGTDDLGATVNTTTTTNASGAYSFGNLRPGTYTLTETQPAGLFDGKETAGGGVTTPGTVNNAAISNTISGIVVGGGETGTANNFGELPPSILSGSAYLDANNDGVFQGGETAQSGMTVTLTGTDDLGSAVTLTTTTGAGGAYTFGNLRPGTYTLTETQPAALLDGRETVGTQGSGTVLNTADSNTNSGIVLAANVTGTANNFADLRPAALTGTDDVGAAVNVTVATLADGSYSFINLRASDAAGYTITETQPAGFLDGSDALGMPGGVAGNDVFSAIVLADGVSGAANNFGELRPAMLAGTVFRDDSNDGAQQAGEPGVANVPVTTTAATR